MSTEQKVVSPNSARSPAASSKMHRPARPDFDQYKKELAEVDAKIDTLRKEQDEVKARINRNDPRKGPSADKRGKLLDRLQDIRKEQGSLKKSRGKVFDRHAALTASVSKKTADLKAQQSKLTYKTIDAIDEVLAKHQSQIDSGNLKIVEERRLSDEMAGLRRAKKQVEQTVALQKNIEAELAELAEIDEQIAGTNARALGEEYDRLQSELDSLKASQEEGHQKRGELFSERSRILKELDQAWEFKRRLQDDHRRVNNEYYQWQQQERIRKANEEKQRRVQELREKRLAIAQEQREEAEIPAFEDEINGCDSLIIYLNGIQPSTTGSPGSKSENSTRPSSVASTVRGASSDLHIPAGMLALKKTNDEADYFAGSSSSKSKRRNERKEKRNSPTSEILKLPLAVAERFLELEVDIPTTSASIAATIEKLEARKQYFIDNQAKVTNENKRKAEQKIAKLMSELEVDEKIATAVAE